MRKIIISFCIFVLSSFLFADSFQETFNKAKKYEEEKKFIYALTNYYAAKEMVDKNSEDFNIAEEKYESLKENIKAGNLGVEDLDAFELYDKWIELLKEFEHYWTEYCPMVIWVNKLERQSLNMENRTGDYSMQVITHKSDKYYEIKEIVSDGLIAAMRKNKWQNDNLEYFWPDYSVYNITCKEPDNYLPDNIPLIYTPFDAKIDGAYRSFKPDFKIFVPTVVLHYYEKMGSTYSTDDSTCILPFVFKFKIVDLEGNLLFESKDILFRGGYLAKYTQTHKFTLTEEQMKIIDNGDYKIIPTNLNYLFGKISDENAIVITDFNWTKTLKYPYKISLYKANILIQNIK